MTANNLSRPRSAEAQAIHTQLYRVITSEDEATTATELARWQALLSQIRRAKPQALFEVPRYEGNNPHGFSHLHDTVTLPLRHPNHAPGLDALKSERLLSSLMKEMGLAAKSDPSLAETYRQLLCRRSGGGNSLLDYCVRNKDIRLVTMVLKELKEQFPDSYGSILANNPGTTSLLQHAARDPNPEIFFLLSNELYEHARKQYSRCVSTHAPDKENIVYTLLFHQSPENIRPMMEEIKAKVSEGHYAQLLTAASLYEDSIIHDAIVHKHPLDNIRYLCDEIKRYALQDYPAMLQSHDGKILTMATFTPDKGVLPYIRHELRDVARQTYESKLSHIKPMHPFCEAIRAGHWDAARSIFEDTADYVPPAKLKELLCYPSTAEAISQQGIGQHKWLDVLVRQYNPMLYQQLKASHPRVNSGLTNDEITI